MYLVSWNGKFPQTWNFSYICGWTHSTKVFTISIVRTRASTGPAFAKILSTNYFTKTLQWWCICEYFRAQRSPVLRYLCSFCCSEPCCARTQLNPSFLSWCRSHEKNTRPSSAFSYCKWWKVGWDLRNEAKCGVCVMGVCVEGWWCAGRYFMVILVHVTVCMVMCVYVCCVMGVCV